MHKMKWYWWVLIGIILLVFFMPKEYLVIENTKYGESGFTEESQCFGFKFSFYPPGCYDCMTSYLCSGLTYGKNCYVKSLDPTIPNQPAACE